ncbi:hypothetical protein [Spongiactinospora sp. TRM90649]|uniref:hypothetical protein n=1 Tax=Spongiactinospora sp. TRM90649 TaxID=3031114 RepID=UPI0023F68E3D|nr:hypothetical protein [Spongiactinospora sp. TRM90649]MDF5756997.1 hypothetical protein [Spongiactinospora sp. TRM90649]
MRILARVHQLPVRWATGAYILNAGITMADADEERARGNGMAAGAFPFLKELEPRDFVRRLSLGEIALGAALLLPVVPSLVAGAALTGFAAGLLGMYYRTPGMRREGSLRPSEQGVGLAKDVWLLGIGLGLVAEELLAD